MGLAEFIRSNLNVIEKEWEECTKTLTPSAAQLNVFALRDHLPEILAVIATDIDRAAREWQRDREKSIDRGRLDEIAAEHATMQLNSRFDLEQIIQEYSALRVSVPHVWIRSLSDQKQPDLYELSRFNACIDQAVAQVVQRYASDLRKHEDYLVSTLVHDIRSSLNLINIAAYALLESSSVTEAQTNNISRIFKGVQEIDRLMNDLPAIIHSRA